MSLLVLVVRGGQVRGTRLRDRRPAHRIAGLDPHLARVSGVTCTWTTNPGCTEAIWIGCTACRTVASYGSRPGISTLRLILQTYRSLITVPVDCTDRIRATPVSAGPVNRGFLIRYRLAAMNNITRAGTPQLSTGVKISMAGR